jgi:hypothetical protein
MGKIPRRAAVARSLFALQRAINRAVQASLAAPSSAAHRTGVVSELLEKRQLLTVSHGPLAKLDSTLTYAYQDYVQSSGESLGTIEIEAYANSGDRKNLVAALTKLNSSNISGTDREVDAMVQISALGKIAKLPGLHFADASSDVVDTGSVTSQGDVADIAAAARAAYNISGAGVTIGILSDSFNNNVNKSITDTYSTDVASGDLPANVQILSDNVPGTDEGRAIAQVIYDSAPSSTIKFATAAGGQSTMAANIIALANAGCKVIVDDYSYVTEPMFEDGVIAQAVETVIARGVTYISAAGNLGEQSYGSSWRAGTTYAAGAFTVDPTALNAPSQFYAGTSFNFNTSGGVNDKDSFQLAPGKSINLSVQWDSPYYSASNSSGGATNQVDVYVLNSAGTMIEGGSVSLVTGKDPIQQVQFTNPSTTTTNTYKLMFVCETGSTAPDYIKYVDFSGQATSWQYTATGTNASTIFGHANAAGVIAVGAVNYANTPQYGVSPPVLETYSGEGGTPIYFNTSGGKLASTTTRQEPVVDGPDDVFNTFFGTYDSSSPPTYSFSGTSAGAASVAGVVALLISINQSLTPSRISTILGQTAIPIGTSPNYLAGYGLAQTVPAVAAAVGNVTGTVFSDNNANGVFNTGEPGLKGVTVFLDLNNNGLQDPGEPYAVTAANGTYTIANYATGTYVVRAVQPPGYIGTLTSDTVTIVGATTTTGANLGYFPDVYNATSANYTVQMDATTTTNVDILVGSTLQYSVPLAKIPSFAFNLSGGNSTLTVNFANGDPVPAGGITLNDTGTSGNSLIINGTSANDTANVSGESTTFDNSIISAADIQSEIINGNGGNDAFSISTAQPATEALTFNGGVGNDSLTVNDILPNNGVGTTFNAGTGSTDQNTLTVNIGTFTFSGDPAAQASNLTVNVGSTSIYNVSTGNYNTVAGVVNFAAGPLNSGINQRNIAALNISGGQVLVAAPASHKDRALLITASLSIASGFLDLSGNDMIITSGNIGTVTSLLGTGFNNGAWNGLTGIESSMAASDTTHLTALGSILNNATGSPLFGSGTTLGLFDGISPATTAILIKYTYYGDTNLNGKVDGTDYSRIDSGYINNQTSWANGDFNYDGTVNGSDYTLIDNAFNTQGPSI